MIVPDADLGDSIEVYLLASDCEPPHSGYAYLDGALFGRGRARGRLAPTRSDAERIRHCRPRPAAAGTARLVLAPPRLATDTAFTRDNHHPTSGAVI